MKTHLVRAGVFALLLSACAPSDPAPVEGGMGLPQQMPGETYPGERREIAATLELADNGCLHVLVDGEQRFAIWPARSELADAGARLPNGEVIEDGDALVGVGTAMPAARLTAEADGYWSHTIGFCDPDAVEVIVFDAVELAAPGE